jgi:phage terminase large subunit GpA-like protein
MHTQRGVALVGTPTAVDAATRGKKLRRGIKVLSVTGDIAKKELYNNLRKHIDTSDDGSISYPAGFVHLPKVDAEFVQQLCAEQLVTRRNRHGFAVREWQKMRECNEALDCYVYAQAAASLAGLDRFEERQWRELEKQLGIVESQPVKQLTINNHNDTTASESNVSKEAKRSRRLIHSRWMR